jgi:hypothetical protein
MVLSDTYTQPNAVDPVLNDMSVLATRPGGRPQALKRLHRLLLTFA